MKVRIICEIFEYMTEKFSDSLVSRIGFLALYHSKYLWQKFGLLAFIFRRLLFTLSSIATLLIWGEMSASECTKVKATWQAHKSHLLMQLLLLHPHPTTSSLSSTRVCCKKIYIKIKSLGSFYRYVKRN